MIRYSVWLYLLILGMLSVVVSQDEPLTSDISYEVLTDVLEIADKPQTLIISINCNSDGPVQYLALDLQGIPSVMSLVSATLNNKPLWLIQSKGAEQTLPNILSWHFEKENSRLVLYPGSWAAGYLLDIEIQVSIDKLNEIRTEESETVRMETQLPSGKFSAISSGRGNKIIFQ